MDSLRPILRQAARVVSAAEWLALLLCLACLGVVGAQASTEPPTVESTVEASETLSENDDEWRVSADIGQTLDARADGRTSAATRISAVLHALVAQPLTAPAPLTATVQTASLGVHACAAGTFLAPVRPRGPTALR